jgi:ABC-type multidrug transport system fused ATPase/permease subunit
MKLLFLSAIRTKKHLVFALFTLASLFMLTIADQMETLSLGVVANNGADFFQLFGKKTKSLDSVEKVSLEEVQQKWKDIDKKGTGEISKVDAAKYLSESKQTTFFNRYFYQISAKLDFEKHFKELIYVLLAVALFKAIFLFFSRYAVQVLAIKISQDLRLQYFEHIQLLPLSFYEKHNVGSLTSRAIGDAGQIASSLNSCLINYLQTPFAIIMSLTGCFLISWQLSCVIFVGLPLIIFPVIYLTKKIRRVSRQMLRNQESFTSLLIDFLSGIQIIKIFSMEAFSLRKYSEQNSTMAHLQQKSAKYSLLIRPILHLVTVVCLAFIVLFGLNVLHMSIVHVVIFALLLYNFYEPVKKFSEENGNIQKGVIAAERMFEVLNIPLPSQTQKEALPIKDLKDSIEFSHVGFKYKDTYVLHDLSFSIKKGQTVALVGPTGAGKSTIAQLLPRLYDVQKGQILIDGIPLTSLNKKDLREMIAYVPQKPFLFYDTVAENISFGKNYTRQQIEEASQQAHAHEFIINLPQQYDTLLAEMGKSLSGGQQQRLSIARALIKKAPILIMDEATSQLDAISEQLIKKTLLDLRGRTTQIIIAHRLTMIEYADVILYLEKGRNMAFGSKEQLLQSSLGFKKLYETFHLKHQEEILS